jgi:hypothetical protein
MKIGTAAKAHNAHVTRADASESRFTGADVCHFEQA